MRLCEDYYPGEEWAWPAGYQQFTDIPGDLRYPVCRCGHSWREHVDDRASKRDPGMPFYELKGKGQR